MGSPENSNENKNRIHINSRHFYLGLILILSLGFNELHSSSKSLEWVRVLNGMMVVSNLVFSIGYLYSSKITHIDKYKKVNPTNETLRKENMRWAATFLAATGISVIPFIR